MKMCPSDDALSYVYYCGPAYPAAPAEGGWPGYQREPETDQIAGCVRLVEDQGTLLVVGNGEHPETFWMVDCDEWASAVENHHVNRPGPDPATWSCKIGEVARGKLEGGADWPMRKAVAAAYHELTGEEPLFIFSGWGSELDERERAVVEDREPS